jgi:hypothetical protein
MKKWFVLFMLLGLGNDILLDSASAECHETAVLCHTCTCIHIINQFDARPLQVVPSRQHFVRQDANLPDFLSDKSIFQPPKAST